VGDGIKVNKVLIYGGVVMDLMAEIVLKKLTNLTRFGAT